MIITQQETLNAALSAVTRASLKSSLAAFSLVRLDVGINGILRLSCFNGETAARAITNVSCDEELSVSVDAVTLKAIVETLSGEICLFVEENCLVIQSSTNRTTLRMVDEPLPIIGDESIQTITVMTGTTFRSLSRVVPFASTDNARHVLQTIHLTFNQETITAQAADGYSAGHVSESIEGPAEQVSISLSLSFAKLLSTLVEDDDTVKVGNSGESHYIFQIANLENAKDLTLTTVTSAENFPSQQIMSLLGDARKSTIAHLNVQQTSLVQSIRMVNAMGTQNTFLKAVNGIVKIASAETETGQGRNILEGTASGQDAKVWLSAVYLKRAADACKGEVTIKISDPKKPVLVEGGSFTAVIMPMLVDGQKDPFPEEEGIAVCLPELAMA